MSQRLSWCRPCGGITTYCLTGRPWKLPAADSDWSAAVAWRAAASAWPTAASATCDSVPATDAVAAAGRLDAAFGAGALCSPCPAVATSSAAVTSLRAKSCCAAAANGTRHGSPLPRTPATSSETKQATSWAHASQTMQTTMSRTNRTETWPLTVAPSVSPVIGLPATRTSAIGTPTAITTMRAAASTPRRVSPRRLTRRTSVSGAPVIGLLT